MLKKIVPLIVWLAAIVAFYANIVYPIISNSSRFTERYDEKSYEKRYNNSQYVIPQSKTPISDEELLSHAGFQYAKGLNPILINSDHPPLGKYIIGWTTMLTGNNRSSSLIFGTVSYLLMGIIIWKLTHSYTALGIGFLLQSLDTVFMDQVYYSPILDIIQVSFLLLFLLFFLQYLESRKWWYMILMGIAAGAMAGIKLLFPVLVLFSVTLTLLVLWSVLKKNAAWLKDLGLLVVSGSIAGLSYMASYTVLFLQGGDVRTFLGVQKWIFLFWKNNSVTEMDVWGNVIPLILFNQWKVWWGTDPYIQFENWSIMWPIVFIMGVAIALFHGIRFLLMFRTKKGTTEVHAHRLFLVHISGWAVAAILYLLFIPISPRYLMIVYFPLYILISHAIYMFLKKRHYA